MALRVAEAPSVAVNRVATYRELDSDLLRHVAFATIDDIDLRLLTKGNNSLMIVFFYKNALMITMNDGKMGVEI